MNSTIHNCQKVPLIFRLALLITIIGLGSSLSMNAQSCHAKYKFFVSTKNNLLVYFTDSSTAQNYYTRSWSFGDGTTSDSKAPSHTYSHAGTYYVCLKITDTTNHCTNTFCDSITLKPNCSANFTYAANGLSVSFLDKSTTANYHRRVWTFGDGTSGTGEAPSHTYNHDTTYEVCLKVTDTVTQCTSTYCTLVKVTKPSACKAAFTYTVSTTNYKVLTFRADSSNKSTARFSWKMGDGNFKTGRDFTYTYAKDSIYEVCLTVTDSVNNCTDHSCRNITVAASGYRIAGHITAGTSSPYPGRVWLISFNSKDSSLKAIKDGHIQHDSTGSFYVFENVPAGTYYTKAALDTTSSLYHDYLPTYHNDALKWANAVAVVVTNANVSGVDIKMRKGTNLGGKGFVGGKISQGANKVGDPIIGVEVMLLDINDNPVAYTYTDSYGMYAFSNLAFGTYKVYTEVLGLQTIPAIVTISDLKQREDNVEIKVGASQVYPTGLKSYNVSIGNISMYPNPVKDELNLSITAEKSDHALITISDLNGRNMVTLVQHLQVGKQNLQINTAGLANGMYIIQVRLDGKAQILQGRFMKE